MSDLINKMTLYDIISTTIPGSIVLLTFMTVIPAQVIEIKSEINNDLVLFGIFVVIAYSIGWILAELMNIGLFFLRQLKNKINKKMEYVFDFMLLASLAVSFIFPKSGQCNLLWTTLTYFAFFMFLLLKQKKQDQPSIENDEYWVLVKKCQQLMIKTYGDCFENIPDDQLIERIEMMSQSAYFLIQTDGKYGRIHNYNSSKFFSRNLAGSMICVAGIVYYHMIFTFQEVLFWNRYSLIIFLCIVVFFALIRKFQGFENKVKLLIITYYIDFLENKEGNRHENGRGS